MIENGCENGRGSGHVRGCVLLLVRCRYLLLVVFGGYLLGGRSGGGREGSGLFCWWKTFFYWLLGLRLINRNIFIMVFAILIL